VSTATGDFFADPLPNADVITMGDILHDWTLEKKLQLIRAAFQALPTGGAFIAIENVIDDERRHNAFGLMMSRSGGCSLAGQTLADPLRQASEMLTARKLPRGG
jgi:hypothetical protein